MWCAGCTSLLRTTSQAPPSPFITCREHWCVASISASSSVRSSSSFVLIANRQGLARRNSDSELLSQPQMHSFAMTAQGTTARRIRDKEQRGSERKDTEGAVCPRVGDNSQSKLHTCAVKKTEVHQRWSEDSVGSQIQLGPPNPQKWAAWARGCMGAWHERVGKHTGRVGGPVQQAPARRLKGHVPCHVLQCWWRSLLIMASVGSQELLFLQLTSPVVGM